MPLEIVHALGFVKQAAARVNARIGGLDPKLAEAIQQAAGEVARGDLDNQFPLVIWQTGSGTQSNMNANEVIAGRANEILTGKRGGKEPGPSQRPCQQGPVVERQLPDRDAHRRGARRMHDSCSRRCKTMHARLADQASRWDRIVKIGRTHLQDATPLTLGQEFSGYAAQIADSIARVEAVLPRCSGSPRAAPRSAPASTRPQGFADEFAEGGRQSHPAALHLRAEQVRGAGRA